MYRLNPFVHIYQRDETVALFNPLNLSTFYCGRKEYEDLLKNPDTSLIKEEFLVEGDFNALSYFQNQFKREHEKKHLSVVYFLLTSACNYQCRYCFVESRMDYRAHTFMTKEVIDKAIELLKRNVDGNAIDILFYGGEPLLNFDMLGYTVEKVEQSGINAFLSIITNGSIMTDIMAEFIKKHHIQITVSLDGNKETNDKLRIDNNGNGTYEKVVSTIKKLKKHDILPGISCTLSSHNQCNDGSIIPVLEKFGIRSFGYNLPAENDNISFTQGEKKILVRNMLRAEEEAFQKRILEDRIINRRLKAFVEKKNWTRDCAGYRNQIVIAPDGKVGVCHGLWPDYLNASENSYFDLDVSYNGKIVDHPVWMEWSSRTPLNMPVCWTCAGIGLCGGGCAKNSLLRKGSIWEVDDDICLLMEESVPWIIWKYYDHKVKPFVNGK